MSCDEPDCCNAEFRIENGSSGTSRGYVDSDCPRATRNKKKRDVEAVSCTPSLTAPRRCKIPADCNSASPRFLDITYTRRYIWWFLRERVFQLETHAFLQDLGA
jgi:hypothetical protein